jgi:hypothetical protein
MRRIVGDTQHNHRRRLDVLKKCARDSMGTVGQGLGSYCYYDGITHGVNAAEALDAAACG